MSTQAYCQYLLNISLEIGNINDQIVRNHEYLEHNRQIKINATVFLFEQFVTVWRRCYNFLSLNERGSVTSYYADIKNNSILIFEKLDCNVEINNYRIRFLVDQLEGNMAFLSTCSSVLGQDFDGNPLEADSFVTKINLLLTVCENDANREIARRFILTKIKGLGFIDEDDTIAEIIEKIRTNIKVDRPDYYDARIRANRQGQRSATQYAHDLENNYKLLSMSYMKTGVPYDACESICYNTIKTALIAGCANPTAQALIQTDQSKTVSDLLTNFVAINNNSRQLSINFAKTNDNFNRHRNNNRGQNRNFNGNNRGNYSNNGNYNNNNRGNNSNNGNFNNNRGNHSNNGNYNNNRGNYSNNNNNNNRGNYSNNGNNRGNYSNNGNRNGNYNTRPLNLQVVPNEHHDQQFQ